MTCLLHTDALTYAYDGRQTWHYPDLRLDRGGRMLIWGQSGSGKTTLLHLLAGLLSPASGEIIFDEMRWSDLPNAQRDRKRGECMGLVFQRPHFIRSLSARQNITLSDRLLGRSLDEDWLEELLSTLQITHLAGQPTHQLSEGEKQRVGIARAVYHRPSLVIADEPTSALDGKNAEAVTTLLFSLAQSTGAGLITVSHDTRLKTHFDDIIDIDVAS